MSSTSDSEPQPRKYADGPPWIFTGRALYQLHLVKADVARRIIPSELKVVQAFGYTLGGFYLAKYDTSPAGVFDELVVLAGIVWNPPTSCAWAARVIVNSKEACDHGIEEVGLPSRTALFKSSRVSKEKRESQQSWWNILPKIGGHNKGGDSSSESYHAVDVVETDGSFRRPLCNIEFLNNCVKDKGWAGPSIKLSLPSFSGKTKQQPDLLKYSCRLNCRIRPVSPARVSSLQLTAEEEPRSREVQDLDTDVMSVMNGKPIVALAFENMAMYVEAPTVESGKPEPAKVKEPHGLFSWFPRFKVPSVLTPST